MPNPNAHGETRQLLQPKLARIKLDDVLQTLIDDARVQVSEDVELRYIPSKVHVMSDRNMLSRILQNFISNATKYTERGRIIVGCRRKENHVELFAIDSGPGIPSDDLDKLFNDFFRSQAHVAHSGLGLGLAVAKRLADLLEHQIRVDSTPQKGSSFSITLPIVAAETGAQNDPHQESESALAGMNVLYIDDGLDNLNATEALLQRWQCKMTGLQVASTAIDYCEQNPAPDALLMDFQLNDEHFNGLTLAESLQDIWGKQVPVCIISAAAEAELPATARQRGFEFLSKPVKPCKLRAWLNHVNEH